MSDYFLLSLTEVTGLFFDLKVVFENRNQFKGLILNK